MKKTQVVYTLFICFLASFLGAYVYKTLFTTSATIAVETDQQYSVNRVHNNGNLDLEMGFIEASKISTPSVVFIKTESQQYQRSSSFWGFDFDPFGRIGKVASTGSGVIVAEDGYIITNHHVVKSADKIEVVLSNNRRTYIAKLVGADPSSDLALLKVEAKSLTPIKFRNSDDVEIGQWVLAVGNPFNLTSTVTAGIVSAKGRNINIVNNQFPIESFIQTDAAINPGNSGGALVDLSGYLVGVNTAIASKTGSYVGYGFAIPSNIVSKTIADLKEYGEVQRGFAGVDVVDIDGEIEDKLGVDAGVLVKRLTNTNQEATTLLKAGDVITKIDGKVIDAKATFDERMAYLRPGDIVKLEVYRDGHPRDVDLTLVNKEGTTKLLKKESVVSEELGAEFEKISKLEKDAYRISNGIKVTNITNGKIRQMNVGEGFVFVKINGKPLDNVNVIVELLKEYKGQIRIEGIAPNGASQYLNFTFR